MTKSQRDDIDRAVRSLVLRAAIYARVSTEKQEEDGTSLEDQVENCKRLAFEQGILVVEVFREVASGAYYRERKKLTHMREMARNGEIDVVIINTYDRLSRNQTHFAVLFDEMEHLGIKVLCVKEKLDETPKGQFMRSAMAFVAQVQREKIVDLTDGGRRRRVTHKKKILPGHKPPYGYAWDSEKEKNTYIINKVEAKVVKRIYDMYATGRHSLWGIAKILDAENIPSPSGKGKWSDRTVRLILTSCTYYGLAAALKWKVEKDPSGKHHISMRPEDEWVYFEVPAIVTKDLFDKVQAQLQINKVDSSRNNPNPEDTLLRSGFIRCGYCGCVMTVLRSYTTRNVPSYTCPGARRAVKKCSGATIAVYIIDQIVWEYVGELIRDFTIVEEAIELIKAREAPNEHNLKAIEHSIKIAQVQQEQLAKDLKEVDADGSIKLKGRARQLVLNDLSESEKYLNNLYEDKERILVGEVSLKQMLEDIDKFVSWCLNARDTYATASYEEKRRALRMLGLTVFVYRGNDETHDRYEIKLRIPHFAKHTS